MRIHVVDTIEELERYIKRWKEILFLLKSDMVFSQPDWLMSWWKYHGARYELFVLILLKDKEVVGIFPLIKIPRGIYREICFLGEAKASYMDMAVLPPYRQRAIQLVLDFLYHLKGNYIYNFKGLFIDSDFSTLLRKHLQNRDIPFYTTSLEVSYIRPRDEEFNKYYRSRFGRSSSKTMRKKERRLKRLGQVSFELFDREKHDIEDIFKIHEKRWSRKIGSSAFSKGNTKEFFKELKLNEEDLSFKTPIYLLTLNEKIIAFSYGFDFAGRYTSYRVAHDDDFGMLSPGQVLLKKEIEDCFKRGVNIFDFGVGGEPYKRTWTDEATYACTYLFPGASTISKLVYRLSCMKLGLKKRLKANYSIYKIMLNVLEAVKYSFSRENLAHVLKKGKYCWARIIKKPLKLIYDKSSYSMFLVDLDRVARKYKDIEGYEACEVKIDALDSIVQATLLRGNRICRRFVKNDRCILVRDQDGNRCYIWLAVSSSSWVIYDYHMDVPDRSSADYVPYLLKAFLYIRGLGRRKCYVNGKDLELGDLDRNIFQIIWRLYSYRFLFLKRYRVWSEY